MASLAVGMAFLAGTGCDNAKDALKQAAEEAAGISKLEDADKAKLLADAGWDEAKIKNFKVHGGFTLTEKFALDLNTTVKLPLPIDIPEKAQGAAQNQRSLALLRAEKCELEPGKPVTRFRIVTVARYDAAEKVLEISGETINKEMDPAQVVSLANKNQGGTYLLAEGQGDKGLAYLTGVAMLQKDKEAAAVTPVEGACIFTTESPFVTVSGKTGKYFLAMLEGGKGMVVGSKNNIVATYAVPGTPTTATTQVKFAGLLDKYEAKFNDKVAETGNDELKTKAAAAFTKVNTKVTDWLNGWKLIEIPITFKQPPQVAAVPPPVPQADLPAKPAPTPEPGPTPTPTPTPGPTPTPTPATPVTPIPEVPNVDVVREVTPDPAFNENLGCDDPTKLVFDGSKFDTYTADVAGWRAFGDMRISATQHNLIFGNPEELGDASGGRYLDEMTGYCVLTTGDAQFQEGQMTNPIFQPVDDQSSEMWQKLKVPAADSGVKAIQLRVAFFSQEFPKFVGTQYNDSFFIKFDEHLDVIGSGNLNELAGSEDPALAAEVTGCSGLTGPNLHCGEWRSVKTSNANVAGEGLESGELWAIDKDSQATSKSKAFDCQAATNTAEKVKCYHGWVPPRTFCKNLAPEDFGTEKTLRIGITDVGDQYFTSAIAIDSIVFSKADCSATTGFAADPDSRASEL